jgi:glycine cleavage system aminomethyltransferase T
VGRLCEPAESGPPMGEGWPVVDLRGAIWGLVRWAAYSSARERPAAIALLDGRHEAGEQVLIHNGNGTAQAVVANLPFVS